MDRKKKLMGADQLRIKKMQKWLIQHQLRGVERTTLDQTIVAFLDGYLIGYNIAKRRYLRSSAEERRHQSA